MADDPRFVGELRWVIRWRYDLDGTRERVQGLQQAVVVPGPGYASRLEWQDVPEVDETYGARIAIP